MQHHNVSLLQRRTAMARTSTTHTAAVGIDVTPRQPQRRSSPSTSPPTLPCTTTRMDHGGVHPRTTGTTIVSFNDHVEVQHYDPLPDYSTENDDDDDEDENDSDVFHFYDASDRMWIQDDSETDEEDDSGSSSYGTSHRNIPEDGAHRHNNNNYNMNENLIHDTYDDQNIDLLGLPVVDTATTISQSPGFHLRQEAKEEEVHDLLLSQPPRHSDDRSRSRNRPLHHNYHNPLMSENLQGYNDLTEFATLTDSSNSDTDSSSHGSLLFSSHGELVPPSPQSPPSPQQQQHSVKRRHSNLAEQILSSSSHVPPLERINIVVDEYDVSSSSSGSDISDLNHQHFMDPNLYPVQYRGGAYDNDDHIHPEYYFEVQSLDSCFLPDRYSRTDDVEDTTNRRLRHPHYRMSILKQRLRDSVMAVPSALTRFRRDSTTGSSSREETEVEVSSSNDNNDHDDIIVYAEPILLP